MDKDKIFKIFIVDHYNNYVTISIIYCWCFKCGMFDRQGESLVQTYIYMCVYKLSLC